MRRALALLLLLVSLVAGAQQPLTWDLTVLHTNDLHGEMLPFTYHGEQERGGMARRAAAIARLRQTVGHALLVVDAGDTFTRGPWHTQTYGEPEIEAMNLMGYDLACVGNNEFKATADAPASQRILLGLVKRSRFPWLAANLTVTRTKAPVEGIKPYVVLTRGDMRIGVLGLTAPRSAEYAQTSGWTISDPIAVARHWVPIMRKECDILIAVTHIGVGEYDRKLGEKVAGIDAIIGGDSHEFIEQPIMLKNPDGIEVPLVQAGEQGIVLGRLDLTFEKTDAGWRLMKTVSKHLPIDNTCGEDPEVKALLDRYLAPKVPVAWWPAPAWAPALG